MTIDLGAFLLSALVAIGSLCGFLLANNRAKKAHSEAQAANKAAREAVKVAKRANKISVESNKIATDANALIERQVATQNRQPTVKWEGRWEEPGLYRILNVGNEPALGVTARITLDDFVGKGEAQRVEIGKHIDVWMPEVREQCLRERIRPPSSNGIDPSSALYRQEPSRRPDLPHYHSLEEFIAFSTEDGQQPVHREKHKLVSIQPD